MRALITGLFGTLLVSIAGAADYYVSVSGKDTNPGTETQPWRTIQKAADTLSPGDTAWVRKGVYRERVTVNVSGNATDGFVSFRAYPGERVIIDGARYIPPTGDTALFTGSQLGRMPTRYLAIPCLLTHALGTSI